MGTQVVEGLGGVPLIFSHANYFDETALTKQLGSDDSDTSTDSPEPCVEPVNSQLRCGLAIPSTTQELFARVASIASVGLTFVVLLDVSLQVRAVGTDRLQSPAF